MYLLLDPSKKETFHVVLFDEQNVFSYQEPGEHRDLLSSIERVLSRHDMTNDAVTGIMVVVGEGTFTRTRVATTVANVFGYARRIPLLSVTKEQAEHPQGLIPSLLHQPIGQYISAAYSGEPNIGKKKK